MRMSLEPSEEKVAAEGPYQWNLRPAGDMPLARPIRSVWYVGLPLTSAHRSDHEAGGLLAEAPTEVDAYLNEGSVYPHAALVEMITYQDRHLPEIGWRYLDMSHVRWAEVRDAIRDDPPDVIAFSVYTATALWALVVAAEVKRVNPAAVVVFGNDHAGILHKEILGGRYGSRLVDFVSTGNNAPYTMICLLLALQGRLNVAAVPSLAYRDGSGRIVHQPAATYPIDRRVLPDYNLIVGHLEQHYDKAFSHWYARHYDLKRMVTMPLDGGCNWGSRPSRRCRHCSIQGLTPKATNVPAAIPVLEDLVGTLGANVYAAGDSTFGFSRGQWDDGLGYLDEMAEACANSPVLRGTRFMLAYGLVYEFLHSAKLCSGFIRTWNVGLEAFSPSLLRANSKGINKGPDRIGEALELARSLDYKLFASGILGLPGTTMSTLRGEVDQWLEMASEYRDLITSISVAPPGIIPGSRMYWDTYNSSTEVRSWHGEIIPARKLTEFYIRHNTEVTLSDVEAAINDLRQGVHALGADVGMRFGGYMLGGRDEDEAVEEQLLREICAQL